MIKHLFVDAIVLAVVAVQCVSAYEGFFTCTLKVTISVSGTFDVFDVTCIQHHRNPLNPFLNGTKTVTLTVRVKET